MRCTRVGWARGSPRRPSVSGRAVSAGSGGSITAGWRVCATRICGPVRWTWGKWRRSRLAEPVVPGLAVVMERWEAYLAGSGLASATVGHYRRMAGLFLTWLESHGVVSLDGSDGSHVLGFLAGLRSRWSESSMRHAASDLRPLFRWLGRDDLADAVSAWPAYAGPTRSRERCPTTSTAACWRRAPRGRCRRGTRRSPCCR